MFSGIISAIGKIKRSERKNGSLFLTINKPLGWKLSPGDSIATNGVCLTVKLFNKQTYTTELMPETLTTSSFGKQVPATVNLERPITLQTPLDGHIVLGHVDSTAKISAIYKRGSSTLVTVDVPARFSRWMIEKGSITIDGIGLTIARLSKNKATVSLVDYTSEHTTLVKKSVGDLVNVEFDVLAKYLEKLARKR